MNKPLSKEDLDGLDQETLVETVLSLQKSLDEVLKNNELLLEALKVSRQRSYGSKSEVSSSQIPLDLFLNEAEDLSDNTVEEVKLSSAAPRKVKVKGKKKSDLSKITDHREELIELPKEKLDQIFTEGNYRRLPDQIVQMLEHYPARFEAVTYRVCVYCAKDESRCETSIMRADAPMEAFPKSIATPSLVSSIITAKYANGLPLYRQEKAFEQNNIFIDRKNMANWIISSYDRYFSKLIPSFKKKLLGSHIIHADETTLRCSKDCKDREKNYMWVYRSSQFLDVNQVVLFDYQKDRKAEHPEEYLKGFKGTLVCDGYSAYKNLNRDIDIAGCWVHAKRKFSDYVKALGEEKAKGTLAHQGVIRISKIFHEEHKLKDLCDKEHLEKRKQIIKPMVDDFFDWIKENKDKVPLKSQTGKAFTYALNQEDYLRTFLSDPNIPLENNAAERAIRPFTVGRKNWVMIDTPKGARASAAIYSIIETAKMYDLKLYDYIRYLLEELPKYENCQECPEHLLPWSDQLPAELYKSKS